MIIKAIKLKNIRSYEETDIEIPKGSVLLAGDIGAGKTTVLLAIDFALFGVRRGELSGVSLLRHGAEQGFVELNLELNGKNIIIYRSLKSKRTGETNVVSQDSGYIEIDGNKESMSTVEMQSKILNLLNYPLEFVKKNKSLIYRYTVYTPQESMKQILLTNTDDRLTILRKIFDIDRYKTIAQNAEEVARQLRSDCREISGQVADLDQKKTDLITKQEEHNKIKDFVKGLGNVVQESKKLLSEKKKERDMLSKKVEEMNLLKQKIASLESEFNVKNSRLTVVNTELQNLEKDFKPIEKPQMTLEQVNKEIPILEKDKEALVKDKTISITDISKWKAIMSKGSCPTCNQSVKASTVFKDRITGMQLALQNTEQSLLQKTKRLEDLVKIKENIYAYQKFEQLEININKLKNEKVNLDKIIQQTEKDLNSNKDKLDDTVTAKIQEIDKELDKLSNEYMNNEKEYGRKDQQLKDLTVAIEEIKKEINDKERKKSMVDVLKVKENWLSNVFVSLMGIIEKHVMVQIHKEFNALFQKWFTTLVDSDEMNARINNDFSIIVEQNGYETEYDNLSGGERTSVALAYRLALNAVINKIVEHIRTKDLLILDEPTDGFSTDQLEKVRDVLNELNLQQIIIVSHEPKIETFVDSVLRFNKENGITQVR